MLHLPHEAEWDAPTCAYCHMMYVDENGERYSSHNMSRKIIWGMGVQAALGQLEDITLLPENQARRVELIKVCITCHSEDKARGYLESADAHKLAGDALVVEARTVVADLYAEGLVEPGRGQLAAGLLPGPAFSATELPTELAQHWPAGMYYNVTAIEREYFDMFFFSNLKSYKGAFHMSPDYREAEATGRRTLFMLVTGPLMVLAVLAIAFLFWRARRRGAETS
ncbi:MAG: multiheme c-type cytochrome [Gemmatimonadota bacterium]